MIRDTLDFYRHRDNWHKLPVIRSLLCWLGRHDYESFRKPSIDAGEGHIEVILECFYCEHRKAFHFFRWELSVPAADAGPLDPNAKPAWPDREADEKELERLLSLRDSAEWLRLPFDKRALIEGQINALTFFLEYDD